MTAARNISLATISATEFEALASSTRKSLICRITGTLLTNDYARVTGRELTVNDCNRLLAIAESAQDNSKSDDVQVWAEQICDRLHAKLAEFEEKTRLVAEAAAIAANKAALDNTKDLTRATNAKRFYKQVGDRHGHTIERTEALELIKAGYEFQVFESAMDGSDYTSVIVPAPVGDREDDKQWATMSDEERGRAAAMERGETVTVPAAQPVALTADQQAKIELLLVSGARRSYGYFIEKLHDLVSEAVCREDEEGMTDADYEAQDQLVERMTDELVARLTK